MGRELKVDPPKSCTMSSKLVVFVGLLMVVCVLGVGAIVYFSNTRSADCKCPVDTGDANVDRRTDNTKAGTDKPNPVDVVVSTHWLRTQLCQASTTGESKIRVIEATLNKDGDEELFYRGHIPNAMYTTVFECANKTAIFPKNLPEPECFATHVQSLGIRADTHVVVYDRVDPKVSSRQWWVMKLHGHEKLSVLDGGYAKWLADGYETTADNLTVLPTNYKLTFIPARVRHMDAMLHNVKTKAEQIVDMRPEGVYNGSESVKGLRRGHMPGAINIPHLMLFNEDKTFKSTQEIKQILEASGIDLGRPVVGMCTTSTRSTVLSVAMERMGLVAPEYLGSWYQWSQLAGDEYIVSGHR
ncbi:hypothetical protein ScPMuIL_013693 [Solemya velum]